MRMPARGVVQLLLALIVGTACGSVHAPVATTSATPTASLQPTPIPSLQPTPTPPQAASMASPTPSAVFDDSFGFLLNKFYANDPIPGPVGLKVRRESASQPVFELGITSVNGSVVSPDGRRLAYWVKNELRVIDVAANARPRTLLTVAAKGEYAFYMAWSSDGTGIVVGVNGAPAIPAPDAPPAYTAVRVVDVAGGQPREIARVANANVVPLAWDRQARLIAAYEPMCCGTLNYDTITEDGVVKRTPPGSTLFFFQASHDAQQVFGRNHVDSPLPFGGTTILRVWPAGSYVDGVELHSTGSEPIRAAEWRPGTAEIGVLFKDRLEFWTASGARRSISLPSLPPLSTTSPNATLLFRADGRAVLIGLTLQLGYGVIAVDLATGETAVVDWSNGLPGPGTSVRVGP